MHQCIYACAPDSWCLFNCICRVTWKCVTPCGTVHVSQSSLFWSHTLVRMCTCISTIGMCTWLHMYVAPPLLSYMQTWMTLCVCWPRICTCISTCMHGQLTAHVCSIPFEQMSLYLCPNVENMGTPLWNCECVPVMLLLVHILVRNVSLSVHICVSETPLTGGEKSLIGNDRPLIGV